MANFKGTPIRDILLLVSENLFDSDKKAANPCHLLKLETAAVWKHWLSQYFASKIFS